MDACQFVMSSASRTDQVSAARIVPAVNVTMPTMTKPALETTMTPTKPAAVNLKSPSSSKRAAPAARCAARSTEFSVDNKEVTHYAAESTTALTHYRARYNGRQGPQRRRSGITKSSRPKPSKHTKHVSDTHVHKQKRERKRKCVWR